MVGQIGPGPGIVGLLGLPRNQSILDVNLPAAASGAIHAMGGTDDFFALPARAIVILPGPIHVGNNPVAHRRRYQRVCGRIPSGRRTDSLQNPPSMRLEARGPRLSNYSWVSCTAGSVFAIMHLERSPSRRAACQIHHNAVGKYADYELRGICTWLYRSGCCRPMQCPVRPGPVGTGVPSRRGLGGSVAKPGTSVVGVDGGTAGRLAAW